jgi:C-terminal peptidase prc
MKKFLSTLLSTTLIAVMISPSATFAQNKITIENDNGTNALLEQLVTDFLKDNGLVKNCLRNRRRMEKRPLTNSIAYCSIMNTFGNEELSIAKSWKEATKLKIVRVNIKRNKKLTDLEFLKIVFEVAGLTVSPISEKKYKNELKSFGLTLPDEEMKTLIIAIENGIIANPETTAEATLLETDLKKTVRVGEAFGYLYQVSSSKHDIPTLTIGPSQPVISNSSSIELESIMKEVIRIIKTESYFSSTFDERKAMQAAIKAIAESLEEDKYIEYYTEDEYKSFSDGLNGNLEGIGAYIEEKDGKIIVISPIDGSPAHKADLRPEDIITHIDGVTTEGLTLQEAVSKIRGESGTTVKLSILRNGNTKIIPIVRAQIDIPALTTSQQNGIEIIKLVQFSNTSANELRIEIERIANENPRGIIIDLRNNPGGFLDQVINMVDMFIEPNQAIVYLKNRTTQQGVNSGTEPLIKDIPISVLINKGSASASEILAGALQSYGVAKIYGETSFGKGTVQNIITLRDTSSFVNSAFKLTTSEYLVGAPNGQSVSIDEIGVFPTSNPGGVDIVDNRETVRDEALDTVLNLMQ